MLYNVEHGQSHSAGMRLMHQAFRSNTNLMHCVHLVALAVKPYAVIVYQLNLVFILVTSLIVKCYAYMVVYSAGW